MKRSMAFLALILLLVCAQAQQKEIHLTEDTRIVRHYFDSVKGIASPNELIVKAALSLLNTPYVAQTLEGNKKEELVINLMELDCMTLVENCLALSRAAQYPNPDYEDFVRQLQFIRYRVGIMNGYTSRLHYTTDWITDNSGKGIIEDITGALGGKPFQPHVDFMSSHPERYPALKENPQDVEVMRNIEQTINQRDTYYYIPKNEIRNKQSLIQSGDIIGFTTSIPGLDISHVAIAYWNNGQLSFIHASTKQMKVIIHPESLIDYCNGIQTNTGIVVLRVKTVQR
ncbi:xylanase [Bacteroidia bacterium]|nr:xylanase [Bacteroidia bacterium]